MRFGQQHGSGLDNPRGIIPLTSRLRFGLARIGSEPRRGKTPRLATERNRKPPINPLEVRFEFFRVCPVHKVELRDEDKYCYCPTGHRTSRWDVVKRPVGEPQIIPSYELGVRG